MFMSFISHFSIFGLLLMMSIDSEVNIYLRYIFSSLEWIHHSLLVFSLKINKQKPHLKWSWEARRESTHAQHLDANCRFNRKRHTFASPTERLLLYYHAEWRKNFSLPGDIPANENPLHFKLPVSSNGLCLSHPLPTPFSLSKNVLLCSLDLLAVFHRLHAPNCNSLLSPNIPILLLK